MQCSNYSGVKKLTVIVKDRCIVYKLRWHFDACWNFKGQLFFVIFFVEKPSFTNPKSERICSHSIYNYLSTIQKLYIMALASNFRFFAEEFGSDFEFVGSLLFFSTIWKEFFRFRNFHIDPPLK